MSEDTEWKAARRWRKEKGAGRAIVVALAVGSTPSSLLLLLFRERPPAPYLDGYGSVRSGFTMGIVIPMSLILGRFREMGGV